MDDNIMIQTPYPARMAQSMKDEFAQLLKKAEQMNGGKKRKKARTKKTKKQTKIKTKKRR
jgi:hypothetical protein